MKFEKQHNVSMILNRPSTQSYLTIEIDDFTRPFTEWTPDMVKDLIEVYEEENPGWQFSYFLENVVNNES